jgi:hypothetical protein
MNATPQLRPMTFSDLLDAAFRLYRSHFLTFVGITAILQVPFAIAQFLAQVLIGNRALANWLRLSSEPPRLRQGQSIFDILPIADFATSVLTVAVINIVLSLFIQSLLTGALAQAVARVYMGEPITIGSAYRLGVRRYASLILATLILTGVPVLLFALIGGGMTGAALALAGRTSTRMIIGIAVLLVFGLIVVLLPLMIFFWVRLLLTTQAVVLEERGALAGLRRSWQLVGGSFWRVLGILGAMTVLIYILAGIPTTIVNFALTAVGGDPLDNLARNQAITTLVSQIGIILTQPIALTVYTLLYYDLRVRKEGYDIELLAQQAALA